jgi:hypothetical protein
VRNCASLCEAEGRGLEPPTGKPAPDFESARNTVNPEEKAGFPKVGAPGAAVETEIGLSDPDLAVVVKRWESLPAAVQAGIVAMVKAAARGSRRGEG